MDKSGENEACGVNTTVNDQEIASSSSGATKVGSTKVAPQKKAGPFDEEYWKDAEEITLTGITPAQFVGIANAYWAKNSGNRK